MKQLPLEERIAALQAEIDKLIDTMTEEETKLCPGVPAVAIRICITRGTKCQCRAYAIAKTYAEGRKGEAA